jgi:hypothetical protein
VVLARYDIFLCAKFNKTAWLSSKDVRAVWRNDLAMVASPPIAEFLFRLTNLQSDKFFVILHDSFLLKFNFLFNVHEVAFAVANRTNIGITIDKHFCSAPVANYQIGVKAVF